jgi:hypothetical protein
MKDQEAVAVEVRILPYGPHGVVSWHLHEEQVKVSTGDDGTVEIRANQSGLIGLARELLTLAQNEVPSGSTVLLLSKGHAPTLEEDSSNLYLRRAD